jgi:hypothetical protein
MKSRSPKAVASRSVALALTWDGARWPIRELPPKARAFLSGSLSTILSIPQTAELFAGDLLKELRICWVPRLKGGNDVMAQPFETPLGKRLGFRAVKTIPFGDVLGVVYRRTR